MRELPTQVTPSAHEINRRVRKIERDQVLSQMMPSGERELNGDAARPLKDLVQSNGATTSSRAIPSDLSPPEHPPPSIKRHVPWYLAVLCRVGIHSGQWEYVAAGHCSQTRTCDRCGVTKVRTKHRRHWKYVGERTCEQIRICKRCDALSGNRTRHEDWSESWDVGGDRSAHRCLRCGHVDTWSTDCGD